GVASAGFDARRRKANNVFYFLDSNASAARWVSADPAPDEWTSQFASSGVKGESLSAVFPWVRPQGWHADAPATALPVPTAEVLSDTSEGATRTIRLKVSSRRGAPMLLAYAEDGAALRRAFLNGKPLLDNSSAAADGRRSPLRLSYAAPPAEGFELLLEVDPSAPLRLTVQDISFGLPQLPGQQLTPRPAHMMPAPAFRSSDTTVVGRDFNF
ncbi:MAG TPA: hypothetical protein VD968_13540, partial [Pyrinomonadaceae bacterium]|nr:hypothetical protein [Pyrinomonadaceae bacterium]